MAAKKPAGTIHRQMVLMCRLASIGLCVLLNGCAALTNPLGDAVPVRRLPPEAFGKPREEEQTIPLTLLRQKDVGSYRLEPGDTLGVYIEGILGDATQPIPVRLGESNRPPSIGYPIPVREDGTIALPLIPPLPVRGLTLPEVQKAIDRAYTFSQQVLKPGRERILVDLQQPRTYHILVIRQDGGAGGSQSVQSVLGTIGVTSSGGKRGTGYQVNLPAGENDVLNALARTGGLPGLEAYNEVLIERGKPSATASGQSKCTAGNHSGQNPESNQLIRIPLRLRPNEPIPFRPEDVVLNNGDVLFIDSRDEEVFYTGGLLGSNQFILPRDYDLNVVEAICLVKGPLINGGQNSNNLSGNLIQTGLGFPSPSLVSIVRRMPNNRQLTIKVDLNDALRDPRQRVLIQPKDVIILQETAGEAIVRYFTNQFQLNFVAKILNQADATATTAINAP